MSTDLQPTQSSTRIAPSSSKPSWLAEKEVKGVDELTQYIRPPFIKIVQGSAEASLKELFEEQSVVLVPGNDLIMKPGEKMLFTPLFFYVEYLCVNPLELKGDLPMVHDRSFDANGEIAQKARDANRRNEQLFNPDGTPIMKKGKPVYRSYQDTRVFLIVIHSPVQPGMICALTFSRAELRTADRLATLISARQASPFFCIFEGEIGMHKNADFDWWGFNLDNPSEGMPWVGEQEAAMYEKQHNLLKQAFDERRLQVSEEPSMPIEQAPVEQDPTVKPGDSF